MKKFLLFLILGGSAEAVCAQGATEGLLFSQNHYEGTARFTAMGGAFAALGGDITTLSINPAGLGVYRGYELTISPVLSTNRSEANYLNKTVNDSYTQFFFNNVGIIFGSARDRNETVTFNWGIGYNRLNNTLSRTSVQGTTDRTSFLTSIADGFTGRSKEDLKDNIFCESHLIDPWGTDSYIAATETIDANNNPVVAGNLNQKYSKEHWSRVGETVFSMGGNVLDKFYFGVTIGLQTMRDNFSTRYSESAVNSADFDVILSNSTRFQSFAYQSALKTKGTGYNIKLGVIWRPIAGLRWGAYFHTPTWLYLTDEYSEDITSLFENGASHSYSSSGEMEYKLITPKKWGMGLAYTFGEVALISVDYESIDYRTITMYGAEGSYYEKWEDVSEEATANFRLTNNIRVGVEYRINQIALRGGYAFYEKPEKGNRNDNRSIISAGIGYRRQSFFIDGTYAFSPSNTTQQSFYNGGFDAATDYFAQKFVLTLGFVF
ncbi:MAG: hypothetical protein LBT48_05370 [Prevotellaceae bacterium]|jgi:hypothetical protein|nr:hypothetical protein [Prevotellaceae bacterium]